MENSSIVFIRPFSRFSPTDPISYVAGRRRIPGKIGFVFLFSCPNVGEHSPYLKDGDGRVLTLVV